MSETELYELARRRVDRRNRRWLLWGANIMLWLVYIGALTTFKDVIPRGIGAAVAVAWTGVIVFHGILTNMTQERDQAIEGEVERLRQALYEEKPKRLDLDEDGELRDVIDDDAASSQQANY